MKLHAFPYPEPDECNLYQQIPLRFLNMYLILFSHLPLGLTSGLLFSSFPHQHHTYIFLSPMHATCPVHLILLDWITSKESEVRGPV